MSPVLPLIALLLQPAPHGPSVDPASMVMFEVGAITMGTPDDLAVGRYGDGWFINQTPAHEVALAAFALDPHEVSVGEFAQFLNGSCGEVCFDPRMPIERSGEGYAVHAQFVDQPVAWVDWRSADWYCRWAGKRLPTEAEWERAFVGSAGRVWPWLAEHGPKCAQNTFSYEGGRCIATPRPRGAQPDGASVEGVHDLAGNLAEWTGDLYAPHPGGPALGDAYPEDHRVVRGGSFLTGRQPLRAQARRSRPPTTRAVDLGFRCAWDAELRDPEGVVRGALAPAPVVEAPTSPVVSEAPIGEVLAEGLEGPGPVAVLEGVAYVAGREVVYVLQDGVMTTVEAVEIDQWVDDGVQMFGVDGAAETLWRVDLDGPPSLVAEAELPGVVRVLRGTDGWIWTDGQSVTFRSDEGEDERLAGGREGVNGLAHVDGGLAMTEVRGDGTALHLVREDGTVRALFEQGAPLQLRGLTADAGGDLWVFLGLDQWPFSGLLCRLETGAGRFGCVTHTGPKSKHLRATPDGLVWMGQYGVFGLADGPPYAHVGGPLSPTGFAVAEGAVWITESATGRLLRIER